MALSNPSLCTAKSEGSAIQVVLLHYLLLPLTVCVGCVISPTAIEHTQVSTNQVVTPNTDPSSTIHLVDHQAEQRPEAGLTVPIQSNVTAHFEVSSESLAELEAQAIAANPGLRVLAKEYQAARAKVRYADELPAPTLAANFFGHPIETAAGSQRTNLTFAQMLPWLSRLDAQAQKACLEAMALGQVHATEQLKVVGDLRASWHKLYLIQKQIEINSANQELLKSLIDVANARVSTGNASQGDVLIGTLEYSKLEETLVGLRRQLVATKAAINRLVGRDAQTVILPPTELNVSLPDWDHAMLRELAWTRQPEIESARIRVQASRWGVEVAKLRRRPNFTLSASWFAIDDNRPNSSIVDVGEDAWSIGAMMTLPIRHKKYDAMEQEALWNHTATSSSVEQVKQRYDALLLDLWEEARAADATARLYKDTIIPEARRTLSADQASYTNGEVEFDRVVRDFLNLLTLELGFHRSVGRLATSIARIQQAAGTELTTISDRPIVLSTEPNPPEPRVKNAFTTPLVCSP